MILAPRVVLVILVSLEILVPRVVPVIPVPLAILASRVIPATPAIRLTPAPPLLRRCREWSNRSSTR